MTPPSAWARLRDERGMVTVTTIVILFPLTAGLLLVGVQTVLWQHARTLIADRADRAAALVAVNEHTPDAATSDLTEQLEESPDLANVTVTITRTDTLVTVTVTADAAGILAGTRTRIATTAVVPTETWQPLP